MYGVEFLKSDYGLSKDIFKEKQILFNILLIKHISYQFMVSNVPETRAVLRLRGIKKLKALQVLSLFDLLKVAFVVGFRGG